MFFISNQIFMKFQNPLVSSYGRSCLGRFWFQMPFCPLQMSKKRAPETFQKSKQFSNPLGKAPLSTGAQFSLCGPTPKKSSKWSPKTSLLGSPWPLKRPQCGKLGHLKIHSKIHPEKYPKITKIGFKMGSKIS